MSELEPVEQPIRLCKDCRHAGMQSTARYCFHPGVMAAADPVDGATARLCDDERKQERVPQYYPCGRQGYLYEQQQSVTFTDHGKNPFPPIPDDEDTPPDWKDKTLKR